MRPLRRREWPAFAKGTAVQPNPYDPLERTDLTANEKLVLAFTGRCIHGGDESLIEQMVSPNYTQHTHGIGQGREGLRRFLKEIAWKRPHGDVWRPIQVFASGDFVILHKLLKQVVIMDIFRIDSAGLLAEHWDVVQALPTPDYDPMRSYDEDFTRFRAMFGIRPPADG
jgi:predicted SnoaL-like aldol condensation-catalyzing enzyme